jgi:hypothetical protein
MEPKRLIPYSVHLPEEVHAKLKEAAGNRKASALVRDAITLIIEGDDEFNGGYNKAKTTPTSASGLQRPRSTSTARWLGLRSKAAQRALTWLKSSKTAYPTSYQSITL